MTTKMDKKYQENRYEKKETAQDAGSITTPLKENIDKRKNKYIDNFIQTDFLDRAEMFDLKLEQTFFLCFKS